MTSGRISAMAWPIAAASMLAVAAPAQAQEAGDEIRVQLEAMQRELQAQRGLIDAQAKRLEAQQQEIDRLRGEMIAAATLGEERAAGLGLPRPAFGFGDGDERDGVAAYNMRESSRLAQASGSRTPMGSGVPLPQQPVGEDPNLPRVEQKVAAVPEGAGILTMPGRLVVEPSVEFSDASKNRLVFRGFEITPGLQSGVIDASDVDRTTIAVAATARFGLMKNMEIEARVPYLFRWDRYNVAQLRDQQIVTELNPHGNHLGDIEAALRYQINRPTRQSPIFVVNLRVKSNTGLGPYEIPYDEFLIAEGVSTGSGFWAVQPGLNMLLPSDPAVIFAGLSYTYHMARNVNKVVGKGEKAVFIGRVDPGDAINGNLGFGFALNPRFSFSMGYRHTYIFPTTSVLGTSRQRSNRLQVGGFSFGMAYTVAEKRTINFSMDIGTTSDSPNLNLSLRMPFGIN